MRCRPRARAPRIVMLALLFVLTTNLALYANPLADTDGHSSFFLAYGGLFAVDISAHTACRVGQFHVTAPAAARDPEGLVWARTGPRSIGAVDPTHCLAPAPGTGRADHENTGLVARVPLPDTPYEIFITEEGRAYVSHNTLTREGFSISVVDTARAEQVGRIGGIEGIVTGFAYEHPFLYASAVGIRRPGHLYLYRIDTSRNTAHELYRRPRASYRWEIAVHRGSLLLAHVSSRLVDDPAPPALELFDPETARPIARLGPEQFPGVGSLHGSVSLYEGKAYLPCALKSDDRDGTASANGVAVVSLPPVDTPRSLSEPARVHPVQGTIAQVVAVSGSTFAYTDELILSGSRGIRLFFHNLENGREVSHLAILELLEEERK